VLAGCSINGLETNLVGKWKSTSKTVQLTGLSYTYYIVLELKSDDTGSIEYLYSYSDGSSSSSKFSLKIVKADQSAKTIVWEKINQVNYFTTTYYYNYEMSNWDTLKLTQTSPEVESTYTPDNFTKQYY
jgi:hypothetical protein